MPNPSCYQESREKLHQLNDLDEKGCGCCCPPIWVYEFVDSKCKLIHLTFAQWFVLTLAKTGKQDPTWERVQPPFPGGEKAWLDPGEKRSQAAEQLRHSGQQHTLLPT